MKRKIASVVLGVGAASVALSGCSAQSTPESVALAFLEAGIGGSGELPSKYMCGGSELYDGDRWYEPATDLEVTDVEEPDVRGKQRIRIDYVTSGGGEEHLIVTVDLRDMCVSAAQ